MPISDAMKRMAADTLAILKTRAELLSLELEEEAIRFISYLVFALIALVCLSIALLLMVFFVVVLFWDTHRLAAISSLFVFFALAAAIIGLWIRNAIRQRGGFLSGTINELSKDVAALKALQKERDVNE